MKIETMRLIDHYLGNPLCFSLLGFDKIKKLFVRRKLSEVKEILVMKFFGIGSILLASPMFGAIRTRFPDAKIVFLTFRCNQEICEKIQPAEEYLYLRTDNLKVFIRDLLHTLLEFRRHRFSIAIDMEFFPKFSSIMTYLSMAKVRVGFYLRKEMRAGLYTTQVYYNYYKHITEIFLALSRAIGADSEKLTFRNLCLTEAEKNYIKQIITESKMDLFKKVIVNVNAGQLCLERRWPKENFIKLINHLSQYENLAFFFIGRNRDIDYVQGIINSLEKKDRVFNLAGRANLGQLLALFEIANLLITNDGGPLHLAAAMGLRTVSFFGPETPSLYGPIGENHTVFYKGLYCSPCLNVYNVKTAMYGSKRCFEGSNRCMQAITEGEVLEATKRILSLQ